MPERQQKREKNRGRNYSNRGHFNAELSRKELKKFRKAEKRQGLSPSGESFENHEKPTDMEPGQEYHL